MAEKFDAEGKRFETIAVHAGYQAPQEWKNYPLVLPITPSTAYAMEHPTLPKHDELFYSRWQNPSRDALEATIAALEGGKYCCVFASGMSSINTVFQMLRCGDHVVALDNSYAGTWSLLTSITSRAGITTSFIDFNDLKNLTDAMRPETRVVFIETPTNPCCELIDIQKVAELVHTANPKALVVVDNTFATPYFQNPLKLGADIVVHSCTKFINGHHDVLMGAVVTNQQEIFKDLYFLQKTVGAVPSPFECYLCLRGLRTMHIRMRTSAENALGIAHYLDTHPLIEKVMYPGLTTHPHHELAKRQMVNNGFSGMLSFYIKGADEKQTIKFIESLKFIKSAASLGGYHTTAQIPFITSHSYMPKDLLARTGVTANCVRMSAGIENVEDIKADIAQALELALASSDGNRTEA